jgi:hypothetical protein
VNELGSLPVNGLPVGAHTGPQPVPPSQTQNLGGLGGLVDGLSGLVGGGSLGGLSL